MSVGTLRFLVDVNVGRSVVDWLRGEGYDVSVVRDINPRMDDQDILTSPSVSKVEAVRQIVLHHGDELTGHFCVYRSGRLRVR